MEESLARKNICETGRMLLEKRLVARTWGNVSERLDGEYFCISPSGLDYTKTTEKDIVKVKIVDLSYDESGRKPSSEKGIHRAAYEVFPDAGFVIHTHQTYASAVGLGPLDRLVMSDEERERLGGVAKAAYGLSGTKKLSEAVKTAMMTGAHCIMMVNHGAVIVGRDMADAISRAELFEMVCERCVKSTPGMETPAADAASVIDLKEITAAPGSNLVALVDTDDAVAYSKFAKPLAAKLDDMAQMIGRKICVAENSADSIAAALKRKNAVIVSGAGVYVRAETADDLAAMKLLVHKAAVCALYTEACGADGRIGLLDAKLQRFVYLKKYSKEKERSDE